MDLSNVLDPHTVAGLLKLHFREQKTSILPRGPPLTVIMEHVRNRDVSPSKSEEERGGGGGGGWGVGGEGMGKVWKGWGWLQTGLGCCTINNITSTSISSFNYFLVNQSIKLRILFKQYLL